MVTDDDQELAGLRRRNESLKRRVEELTLLLRISSELQSAHDLRTLHASLLDAVTSDTALGFERAYLFLADKERTHLVGVAAAPAGRDEAVRAIRVPLRGEAGILEKAFTCGRALVASESGGEAEVNRDLREVLGARDVVAAPVTARDLRLGVLLADLGSRRGLVSFEEM
jgi:GAF domain-containing protein